MMRSAGFVGGVEYWAPIRPGRAGQAGPSCFAGLEEGAGYWAGPGILLGASGPEGRWGSEVGRQLAPQ